MLNTASSPLTTEDLWLALAVGRRRWSSSPGWATRTSTTTRPPTVPMLVVLTAAFLAVSLVAALVAVLVFVVQIRVFMAGASAALERANDGASRVAGRVERMHGLDSSAGGTARPRRDVATRALDVLAWVGLAVRWLKPRCNALRVC